MSDTLPPARSVGLQTEAFVGEGPDVTAAHEPAAFCLPGYEILARLGRGGMGTVHQARHVESQRLVAVKVLHDALAEDGQHRARFAAESRALRALTHPGIVRCLDAGEHQGRPYFVLELVTGGSLQGRLRDGPFTPREAASLVERISRAVQAAHEAGIVHRDLKPDNVLLTEAGEPKVTDFGLAMHTEGPTLHTQTGAVLGTPAYMAPEQAAGQTRKIGSATDVYALGAILYALLTGKAPFTGEDKLGLLERVRVEDPARPSSLRPDVPRDLETICLKAMNKEPARRYASAEGLADDLRRFLENRPIKARPVGVGERLSKWRARNPVLSSLLLAAGVLLFAVGLGWLWYWDGYLRLKMERHGYLENHRGVLEGARPITEAEARGRSRSYRVFKRGGLVERVECVDAEGRPASFRHDPLPEPRAGLEAAETVEPSVIHYRRGPGGVLEEEAAQGRYGEDAWRLRHTSPTTAFYADARGFPATRTASGATFLEFAWGEDGRPALVRFLDRNGRPRADDHGVHALRFTRREGRVERREYLDARGEPVYDRTSRVMGEERERDGWGQTVRVTHIGSGGKPMRTSRWAAGYTSRYDERGDHVETRFLDEAGKPCLHKDGNHGWRARYDTRGRMTRSEYFGVDGEPCLRLATQGFAAWEDDHDEDGNRVETRGYGTDGKPLALLDGTHATRRKFDARGRVTEDAYFGADGKPTMIAGGSACMRMTRDEAGRVVERRYFGSDGVPCLHNDGNHAIRYTHDERGDQTGTVFLGLDQRPCLVRDGYSSMRTRYDEEGREVERRFFGADGKPCLTKDGNHGWVKTFDEQGGERDQTFIGLDGGPTTVKAGYSRHLARYDAQGRRIELWYFGADGKPCLHKEGNHGWRVRYDARGNEVEVWYIGVDGEPIYTPARGAARLESRRDERGLEVERRYFGADGKPCLHPDGNAGLVKAFDERGLTVRCVYQGVDGKPGPKADGVVEVRAHHDRLGKEVEEAYFDASGKPMTLPAGYHRVAVARDSRGQESGRAYFAVDGSPVRWRGHHHRVTLRRDERGNVIEEAFFGPEGVPVRGHQLFHRSRYRFDARGNQVEADYFGPDGSPTRHRDGNASLRDCYDERDRLTQSEDFGPDGRPCLYRKVYSRIMYAHDGRDRVSEEAYFGVTGKPTFVHGAHRRTFSHDEAGRMISTRAHSADGKPLHETRFDKDGPVEKIFFGPDGERVPSAARIMRVDLGSAGERLDLRPGDLLQRYDGAQVRSAALFTRARKAHADGGPPRRLVVARGKTTLRFELPPGPLGIQIEDVPADAP